MHLRATEDGAVIELLQLLKPLEETLIILQISLPFSKATINTVIAIAWRFVQGRHSC